jgi:hypothetical protein
VQNNHSGSLQDINLLWELISHQDFAEPRGVVLTPFSKKSRFVDPSVNDAIQDFLETGKLQHAVWKECLNFVEVLPRVSTKDRHIVSDNARKDEINKLYKDLCAGSEIIMNNPTNTRFKTRAEAKVGEKSEFHRSQSFFVNECNDIIYLNKQAFKMTLSSFDEEGNVVEGSEKTTILLPDDFDLVYATTIHKNQGLTLAGLRETLSPPSLLAQQLSDGQTEPTRCVESNKRPETDSHCLGQTCLEYARETGTH